MDLIERCIFMTIGGVIGFILGVIVTRLREIKEELDEVDHLLKDKLKEEEGALSVRGLGAILQKWAVPLVVLLVAYSAFASQKASNKTDDTADQLNNVVMAQGKLVTSQGQVAFCNRQFLNKTIVALNERATFTAATTKSNVDLQAEQARFFGLLLERPPQTEREKEAAAQRYNHALQDFLALSKSALQKVVENDFPTSDEFSDCLINNKKENP